MCAHLGGDGFGLERVPSLKTVPEHGQIRQKKCQRNTGQRADPDPATHFYWVVSDDWDGLLLYESLHCFSGKRKPFYLLHFIVSTFKNWNHMFQKTMWADDLKDDPPPRIYSLYWPRLHRPMRSDSWLRGALEQDAEPPTLLPKNTRKLSSKCFGLLRCLKRKPWSSEINPSLVLFL